jgi:hypothetical protein
MSVEHFTFGLFLGMIMLVVLAVVCWKFAPLPAEERDNRN